MYLNIDFEKNRHLLQLKYEGISKVKAINLENMEIMISNKSGEMDYKEIEHPSTVHWGQRKLLLSEIYFLMRCSKKGNLVIYAGAAPGTHIELLSQLFPTLQFILVDPSSFQINESNKISIINDYFTLELIDKLPINNREVLFISDIRRCGYQACKSMSQYNKFFTEDMEMQQQWVVKLRPKYSLLKFKLPFGDGFTEYLKGEIHFPIFGRQNTSESRLLVSSEDNFAKILYSNRYYERRMAYFNMVTRVSYYIHDIKTVKGLDHCYDCASEVRILTQYLNKFKKHDTTVEDLSNLITTQINISKTAQRTLATVIPPHKRTLWFNSETENINYTPTPSDRRYIMNILGEKKYM